MTPRRRRRFTAPASAKIVGLGDGDLSYLSDDLSDGDRDCLGMALSSAWAGINPEDRGTESVPVSDGELFKIIAPFARPSDGLWLYAAACAY